MDVNIQKKDTYHNILTPSTITLIITGIFALLGLGLILAAILISENKLKNINNDNNNNNNNGNTGTTGTTGFYCVSSGTQPQINPPSYTRLSPKSTANHPLSSYISPFDTINHSVHKSSRTRSIQGYLSPNHWMGNTFYNTNPSFNSFPYNGHINDDSLSFYWPTNGTLMTDCNNNSCTGNSDLTFTINPNPEIKLGSSFNTALSCDILDVDALVTTIAWQYSNPINDNIGVLTVPLAKGCPYITGEVNNLSISLECNFNIIVDTSKTTNIYDIKQSGNTDGFILILSSSQPLSIVGNNIYIQRFTGVLRLAYYDLSYTKTILLNNYSSYPIESTIDAKINLNTSQYDVDISFQWTTANMTDNDDNILMIALPHHNIINVVYESELIYHPLIGPYRYIITNNNSWILEDAVADYNLEYPLINNTDSLRSVWRTEMSNLLSLKLRESVNWIKWLGSIAILLLIGKMLQEDITAGLQLLLNDLTLLRTNKGNISSLNKFVYDKTWNGVISNLGLNNCSGDSDDGNAFYQSHIGQYGYLIYAYAVAGYLDSDFLSLNKDIALLFVRSVMNPYQNDNSFPLWRNKDWYFGYSISSGLSPYQTRGKETDNIGEAVLGYYGCYLLSLVLSDEELKTWSITMLATEITSLQYYFQVVSQNKVDIDPAFVQQTVVERGDTYYSYDVNHGNITFPARNASIMVPIIKPITMISFDYINNSWANYVQLWMTPAVQSDNIQPESFAYGQGLLAVNATEQQQNNIIQSIVNRSNILLPPGSTWSSILYWTLSL